MANLELIEQKRKMVGLEMQISLTTKSLKNLIKRFTVFLEMEDEDEIYSIVEEGDAYIYFIPNSNYEVKLEDKDLNSLIPLISKITLHLPFLEE